MKKSMLLSAVKLNAAELSLIEKHIEEENNRIAEIEKKGKADKVAKRKADDEVKRSEDEKRNAGMPGSSQGET